MRMRKAKHPRPFSSRQETCATVLIKKGGFSIVRLKRIWSPEHFHHVTMRGNWRGDLYRDEKDYRAFLFILMDVCKDNQVEIISYCLMSNHYHLLLRTQTTSISIIMARINKHYADYYNNRHQVSGHLYDKPFFSKPVYDSVGLLEVSRYIHLNPIEANITAKPQNYRWSSFQYYYSIRRTPIDFLTLEPILEHFTGKSNNERKRQYCNWMVHGRTSDYRASENINLVTNGSAN